MKISISILLTLLLSQPIVAAELLYFYDSFCGACQKFDEEVGSYYNNTAESKVIPIRKVEFSTWRHLADKPYAGMLTKTIIGTPTFVMVEDGQEIDRLVGYSNNELFWLSYTAMQNKLKGGSR